MKAMIQIRVEKVRLYAYHGLVPGEEVLGGEFEVTVRCDYEPSEGLLEDIGSTIDYTKIYDIIVEKMKVAVPLLETVAQAIAREIIAKFAQVNCVAVAIDKLQPPIASFEGTVGVTYTLNRD